MFLTHFIYSKLKKPDIKKNTDVIRTYLPSGGAIAYLSIYNNLKYCLKEKLITFKNKVNDISIQVGIDGIPLFKSSPVNLWPILFTIKNVSFRKPLPIAVFAGIGNPNFEQFCNSLVMNYYSSRISLILVVLVLR